MIEETGYDKVEHVEHVEKTSDQLLDEVAKDAAELELSSNESNESNALDSGAEIAATAAMLVGVVETGVKFIFPYVDIDSDTRSGAIDVIGPLIAKYGISVGGRFAAEINAVVFLGMAGLGVYQQVVAHKREGLSDGQKPKHQP